MNSSEAWNFCSKLKVIYTLWKVLKNWWTRRQIILNMLQKKQLSMKNLWFSHLLHPISSGQGTPNSSMSFEHSLWAHWHSLQQGKCDTTIFHTDKSTECTRRWLETPRAVQIHHRAEWPGKSSNQIIRWRVVYKSKFSSYIIWQYSCFFLF